MSLKVLLADAGDILKSVLELSEEEQDIEVVHVTSGTDALLRIKEIKPDVLIADVAVPGVDGYSLCEIVRTEADLADMKSVLTSEEGTEVDNTRAEAAASDGHLPKPFNAEKLLIHLGMKTPAEDEPEEEEVQDEGAFQMDVSDDMSFADVALSEERKAAEEEFVVEERPMGAEEETEDEEDRKPESLDSILGLDDEDRKDHVDVDLGGEEPEEAMPIQAADSTGAGAEPFDTPESPASQELEAIPGGGSFADAATEGSMAGDLASEEGQALVEEIVKRLSDKVVREVAWEVVPELAERIIKEHLEKITK